MEQPIQGSEGSEQPLRGRARDLEILRLRDEEKLPVKEIAERFGISLGNAKNRLASVRWSLRLEKDFAEQRRAEEAERIRLGAEEDARVAAQQRRFLGKTGDKAFDAQRKRALAEERAYAKAVAAHREGRRWRHKGLRAQINRGKQAMLYLTGVVAEAIQNIANNGEFGTTCSRDAAIAALVVKLQGLDAGEQEKLAEAMVDLTLNQHLGS